ncbi:ATP-binding protein [Marinomonas sp. PE14-40]|uniref:HAMP domain-containing sensor histidine kinase n=1 Tax=Marinomonas sp. PE14-40 TaxID=3060621 RepID=UPI003F6796F3
MSNLLVVTIGAGIIKLTQKRGDLSRQELDDTGHLLVSQYESAGMRVLRRLAEEQEKKLNGRLFLYEENGRALLLPLPKDFGMDELLEDETGELSSYPAPDFHRSQFSQIRSESDRGYMLIFRPNADMRPPNANVLMVMSLFGLLFSSAVLAYWLLGPLVSLQRMARAFGQGNMDARLDYKLAERSDAIGKLALEFNEMASRVEGVLLSKERLMRDVSHELRTPLARIEVALVLAEDKHGQDAQHKYLDRIRDELHELDALIGSVLLLSRLEEGALDKQEVDINLWLASIIDDVVFESQFKNIDIIQSGQVTKKLLVDPVQLRHALENVLRNACFYSGNDSLVSVTVTESETEVVILVRDSGAGVDEIQLDKIFHAFYRSSDAREANSGGFGVGLTIAQRILAAHKGQIKARNHEQGGLEVCLSLPLL